MCSTLGDPGRGELGERYCIQVGSRPKNRSDIWPGFAGAVLKAAIVLREELPAFRSALLVYEMAR